MDLALKIHQEPLACGQRLNWNTLNYCNYRCKNQCSQKNVNVSGIKRRTSER
ncbi:hypothetical protein BABINDRAFT_161928 [Babjeviella inositovora NRRL Y-12698]|uniref:Uncharacterized protein n=1 Tax=Babjeviella inositovora NRRL Y-12698 TaxID=984486 RepID=A0A1E3QPH1_9ASCO|nr:uncharacterized protein BABINDRAFT_161928 [Babjeviella inositovora NRRL Y-12698]ODQ79538.1 hypothetical protein BABINDRAFT_161928 [Babjeviella inositovora NRRL Y-12698]